jgi:hypothetical protein
MYHKNRCVRYHQILSGLHSIRVDRALRIEIMNKCVLLYWRVSPICERNASTRQVNRTVS